MRAAAPVAERAGAVYAHHRPIATERSRLIRVPRNPLIIRAPWNSASVCAPLGTTTPNRARPTHNPVTREPTAAASGIMRSHRHFWGVAEAGAPVIVALSINRVAVRAFQAAFALPRSSYRETMEDPRPAQRRYSACPGSGRAKRPLFLPTSSHQADTLVSSSSMLYRSRAHLTRRYRQAPDRQYLFRVRDR